MERKINVTREEQKKEAIERMKIMGIFPQTIFQFAQDDYISRAEPPLGAFYWLEGEDLEKARALEKDMNAVVYMVVRSFSNFGTMDNYFYVSPYKEEWAEDRDDLRHGEAVVYVENLDMPDCSEGGYIQFVQNAAGSITRTA